MVRTYSYDKDKNVYLTPHFQVGEFRSFNDATRTLTTNTILIDDQLPSMLEKLYTKLDSLYGLKSIIITSGYRSEDFEESLAGGVRNGTHTQGKAADIVCYKKDGSLVDHKNVCCVCQDLGFNGIGYGGNYAHVDVRDSKSYFDETNGKTGIVDFYQYFGMTNSNSSSLKHQLGERVVIDGIYVSSDSTERLVPKIRNGIITKIVSGARNPYLLNGGNIGWVNDQDIVIDTVFLSNAKYGGSSIVDGLNLINIDSSYEYRSKLASVNGISNYSGTSEQNTQLLQLLKEGKLIKA